MESNKLIRILGSPYQENQENLNYFQLKPKIIPK